MSKKESADIRERLQDKAKNLGRFTIKQLAEWAVREGVYARFKLESLALRGVQADVKSRLKETLPNGAPAFVALERGPGAQWVPWMGCTKSESRRAIQVFAVGVSDSDRALQDLVAAHRDRFHEDVDVPKLRRPLEWDEDAETPPVARL